MDKVFINVITPALKIVLAKNLFIDFNTLKCLIIIIILRAKKIGLEAYSSLTRQKVGSTQICSPPYF